MSKEVAKKPSKFSNIRDLMVSQKKEIAMAIPKHLNADKLCRIALTTFRRNPKLLNCPIESLLGAVIRCGQLGFEPNDMMGNIYLIPFGNDVQVIIGYQGMIDLARRSGQLVSINARIVYDKEVFKLEYGMDTTLKHIPKPPAERGGKIGVYAVAKLKDGGTVFEWMWKEDVEKVKAMSKTAGYENSVWKKWEDAMWRKSVIRQLFKFLPKSVEIQNAIMAEETTGKQEWDDIKGIDIDDDIIDVEVEDLTNNKTKDLTEKLSNAKGKTETGEYSKKLKEAINTLSGITKKSVSALTMEYTDTDNVDNLSEVACESVYSSVLDAIDSAGGK